MTWIPENADYLLGGIPDSLVLLTLSVVYGIVWYRVFIRRAKQMNHYFSTWLDDDCVRCEFCGVNYFTGKGSQCSGTMQAITYLPPTL